LAFDWRGSIDTTAAGELRSDGFSIRLRLQAAAH